MSSRNTLTFDIVIATRNRPDALALSIPLLLSQSRLPQKLIVIDSSDDHAPVAQIVAETTAGHDGIEVIVEHSEKGLTRQRNRGLTHVTADIVFLPDDDSMCFPGTTEAIMAVYERDTDRLVAGVAPADSPTPPPGFPIASTYKMSDDHRWHARTVRLRAKIARLFTPAKPIYVIGTMLKERDPQLPWLSEVNALRVEWMTGYRMSFRREAITAVGFEQAFSGHALYEDIDASFAVARYGALVGTHGGQIYHHRFPSGRGSVYTLTVMAVLNLAYVLAKSGRDLELDAGRMQELKRKTKQNHRLRLLRAWLRGGKDKNAAEERRALTASAPMIDRLFAAPRTDLAAVYLAAQKDLDIG